MEIEVSYQSKDYGLFHDAVIITFEVNGVADTVRVPIKARGLCTNVLQQKCDPPGPLCRIDENTSVHALCLIKDYSKNVTPAILRHQTAHFSTVDKYELPADYLWSIIGLSAILGNLTPIQSSGIPIECLTMECKDALLGPIKFTHVPGTTMLADFEWTAPKIKPVIDKQVMMPDGKMLAVKITFPDQLRGRAVVGPSYTEMHYRVENEAPRLKLSLNGKAFFDDAVHCCNTTLYYGTIRSYRPSPTGSVGILVKEE
jgi:hypothetical protein